MSANWDSRIGRRVRLRDLHILFAVVQHGSMAKAGPSLGMSQSAVSQAIAALEHALGVPLLDRTPRGVDPTIYGTALMRRGQAAFDELRSGVKDIEFLANPEIGEIRIASTEAIAGGILPPAIERFSLRHPRVKVHVLHTSTHVTGCAVLRERAADVVLTLGPFAGDLTEEQAEVLFHDRICLAVARQSPWARRRKLDFADLVDAAFISPATDSPGGAALIEAFRAAGLPMPQITVSTYSVHLRNVLSMRGHFVAVLPASIIRFNPALYALKELPVELPMPRLPAAIVTLKNRTSSPVVQRFIECTRAVAKVMHTSRLSRARSRNTENAPQA